MKCPKCHYENPDDTRFCGRCGTQLPKPEDVFVSTTKTFQTPLKELTIGSTFAGRYQVIEELGKGGMGRVYKVFDKEIKEKVALKLLNPEITADEQTIERFRNELKFARKISHRNVCRMFDLSKEGGTHFITMEYVSGEDLKSSIRRVGPLSAGKAVFIARQVCEGLAEAHRMGVVHRDLKPQNIMIDREGNARIMDFGIARSVKAKGITDAGVMIGTPEYMSVEQVEGKKVDQRSDIYSFGVILYEMVTGRLPFEGDTPLSIALKHKSEAAPDPRKINAQIPENLSRVILRCMEKDRENRYESADQLLTELANIEKGIPTTERVLPKRKPSTSKEITVTFSLRKLLIPALAAVAVAIIAVIFLSLLLEKEKISSPAGKPSLAIMYFENMVDSGDKERLGEIVTNLLITGLSESQYLNVVSSQRLYDILKLLGKEGVKIIDRNVASQVATKAGAKWMLLGSILQVEPQVILTSQLVEIESGRVLSSERITGDPGEKIFSMVDKLTVEVKKDLSLPAQAQKEETPKVADVTTHSSEAYRYYLEGMDYSYKYYFTEAAKSFMKALECDSTFAMAYHRMAIIKNSEGDNRAAKELITKATKYSDKVTEKEKLKIKSFQAAISGNDSQSIKELQKIVEAYPDEKEAFLRLGQIHRGLRKFEEAIHYLSKAVEIDSLYKEAYNVLAYAYNDMGDFERSIWAINKYISLAPDEANPYDSRADLYAYNGKLDQAIESYKKALEIKPDFYWSRSKLGGMYIFKKDYAQAESCFAALSSSSEKLWRSIGRLYLVLIPLYQGKFEEALRVLDDGIAADRMEQVEGEMNAYKHFQKALIYEEQKKMALALKEAEIGMEIMKKAKPEDLVYGRDGYAYLLVKSGRIAEAEELARTLKKDLEVKDSTLMSSYWWTLGEIEEAKGDTNMALSYLERVYKNSPTPSFSLRYDLAEIYLKTGRLDEAVSELEKALSRYDDDRVWTIMAVKAYYLLGLAYEKSGWNKKAIEKYEEFLDIWKNADPGIPEVEDAKQRLAELKGKAETS